MTLHRSLVNCRGCMLLYMKLIWCSGFPEISAQLEEGVESVCHGILLYVKLLWYMGLPWVYVHCTLCEIYGV